MVRTIGKRCLPLFLAIVLIVSFIPPITAQAASVPGVSVANLSTDTSGGTWNNYDNKTDAIQGKVYGTDGRTCSSSTANTTTLTLKNTGTRPATLSFSYSVLFDKDSRDDSYGRLVLAGTTVSSGENKTGQTETTLQPNATYVVSLTSERGNDYYGQLTMENIKLTPFYTVKWSVNGSIVETDSVKENAYPDYKGTQPSMPDYQGNHRLFLGWSSDPDARTGELQPANLGRVTSDVTYYAIFTSIDTFPVEDPDVKPDVIVKDGATITNPTRVNDDGLKLSKALDRDDDGSFNLTMEGYSTADTTMMNVTEKVPTDFVVIVDQSGSMSTADMATDYDMVPTSKTLEEIAAGNYYIKGDDGQYYRVYAVRDYLYRYYAPNYWYVGDLVDRFGENLGWFMGNTETETTFDNQMYFREANTNGKGVYHPITMTVQGAALTYYIRFKYTNNAGNEVLFNREEESYVGTNCPYYHNVLNGNTIGPGWGIWPVNYNNVDGIVQGLYPNDNNYTYSEIEILGAHTGMLVNYPMYDRHVGYTELRYRDSNGEEHTVSPMSGADKAEYCNANGQAITTAGGSTRYSYNKLYQPKSGATVTRLAALKQALGEFARAVSNEKDTKTGNDELVDNRIAIVGYSSNGYNNNEILTGENLTVSGNNGVQMGNATTEDYKTALVNAYGSTGVGSINSKITDGINAITANGGTQPEYGFQMAKQILDNRTDKTYTMVTGDKKTVNRNTIVIFFTDGQPGDYHESNQYSEANDVVEASKLVKDTGAQVFSIGVFGESDGNPLTYAETNLKAPYDNRAYWPYMGGWVESYQQTNYPYTWHCLRRQWRPDNADYTPVANDTIFDYMSVVSSNYSAATDYIAPTWLSGGFDGNYIAATEGVRGESVNGNQFYRMASNQATLVSAFTQAVTHASTISTSSSSIVLNATSVFKDTINTVDFDVTNAKYTVYKQAIHVNENSTTGTMIEPGALTEIQAAQSVPANGKIEYSGFDYQANYVSYGHPDGYKIVVKVEGLEAKTFGEEIKSNADPSDNNYACGIYEYGHTEPAISIESPKVTVLKAASTYIVDYGIPMTVATDVTANGITNKNVTNGDFSRTNDGKAVYKLNNQALKGETTLLNSAYAAVDSAKIEGKHIEDGEKATVQERTVNMIPASSVYFSDSISNPVTVGSGIGYNAELADEIGTSASASATAVSGTFYFTFYGTGIDVYCTTHTEGGYVSAALFRGSGKDVCVLDNRVEKVKIEKSYSASDYYNTPSISYTGLTAGTYTLRLVANGDAQYKLDGVRVYNPVSAGSEAEEKLNKTDEGNATYLNLRKLLLNDKESNGFTVTNNISTAMEEINPAAVSGVLFIDDVGKVATESNWYKDAESSVETWHDTAKKIYQSQFEVYQANGPKNEIYLKAGQALAFQLNTTKFNSETTKVFVGLSAPNNTKPYVTINGAALKPAITTVMDMYYPVEFNLNHAEDNSLTVTIENEGPGTVAVTNLKITGIPDLLENTAASDEQGTLNAARALFAPITMKTIRMVANRGVDPEAEIVGSDQPSETEEPTVTEEPKETEKPSVTDEPNITEDPENSEEPNDGSLIIDEPEESVAPTPSVAPDEPTNSGNAIQKVIQSITKSISNFFKSIFRR